MPELPEVETSLRGISPFLKGQTIQKLEVRQAQLRWPVDKAVSKLSGQTIQSLSRRGKYIIMQMEKYALIWHLGMSGSMRIHEQAPSPQKHDHIDLVLVNDHLLRYTDPRRFGACILTEQEPLSHKLLAHLGPEPFDSLFNAGYLYQQSRTKKTPIKQFIMDSHIVVGVGNIYACESLFIAAINPKRKACNISLKRYDVLVKTIKDVLQKAILQGGTTLKDFKGSDGKPGYFKQELNVYGRKNQKCVICKAPIKTITQFSRSTFYCSDCQH